jgi:oligopeptide/dipeptide ABC transporter ATP-binding protein
VTALLKVENLRVGIQSGRPEIPILDNVSFDVRAGETLAIVGESGCGKSMTALSVMGLLPKPGVQLISGAIRYDGKDLTKLTAKEMNQVRGKEISMIFQEPMTSLNPSFTIGNQLAEVFKYHTDYDSKAIKERCLEVLEKVKIPDAPEKLDAYPHQLSGGMRQRVMIAMALACNPKILIADEPTTALDVTIQAQILDLLLELQSEFGMTVMIITHDLGVVAETCQRVIVMYAGQVVEEGKVEAVFENPQHPYTRGLMNAIPKLGITKDKLHVIEGTVPDIYQMPKGCRFHPRCEMATSLCVDREPQLEEDGSGRRVRCWHKQ